MELIELQESDDGIPLGRLSTISSIPWTFCCNVLQHHDNEIEDQHIKIFKDKSISVLLYALDLSSIGVSFSDESIDCIDIKLWIITNTDIDDNIQNICEKIPHGMYKKIKYHLLNACQYTSWSDEGEKISLLMNYFH